MKQALKLGTSGVKIILNEGVSSFWRKWKAHSRLQKSYIVGGGGERVTHLYANDCYYAHLSIYRFASQFCKNQVVLDAGSGAGYGTAYLAKNGARLAQGIDAGAEAVNFSKHTFKIPKVKYTAMDLQKIVKFPHHHFDVIFTSNTLEHVPNVSTFFDGARRILKSDGTLIVAVPPIVNETLRTANIGNRYHLNIWSPRQWFYMVNLYFSEIECFKHNFNKQGAQLDFSNTPEQTTITEEDFVFTPTSVGEYYNSPGITVIMVARKPKSVDLLPSQDKKISLIDDSFTRPAVK